MWLHDKIFEFTSLDGEKLKVLNLSESNLIVSKKLSDKKISDLFKGRIIEKSNRLKGFSLLQEVNEKGEIDIDGTIYTLEFKNGDQVFKYKGCKKRQLPRSKKKLSNEEITAFGKIIIDTTTKEEVVEAASTTESASAEATPKKKVEEAEAEVVVNKKYEKEKKEFIDDGYTEYLTKEKSNYRILSKKDDVILAELTDNDYETPDIDDFDIEIDDETKTFTITKIEKQPA